MENETEGLEPQKNQEEVVPSKVELTQEELNDLKHKAEVSSQNFERAKKAELALKELELKAKEETSSDVFSDEGKALQGEIQTLKSELSEVRGELTKKDVLITYPIIREKWDEFETFRADPENKGMNLRTAARAFLLDNGLLEPTRKGLEKTTGGQRIPVKQGMSVEDITKLRETNWKGYQDMLSKGLIKV